MKYNVVKKRMVYYPDPGVPEILSKQYTLAEARKEVERLSSEPYMMQNNEAALPLYWVVSVKSASQFLSMEGTDDEREAFLVRRAI